MSINIKSSDLESNNINKIFTFNKIIVFFKHTDYHGFVHPYNFFEWTSYVREAFFSEVCFGIREILNSPVKMMTAKISGTMHFDSAFGDVIEAQFTVCKIKRVSFDVIVKFFNKRLRQLACETHHTLVFVDSNTQGFTEIPEGIKDAIVRFQEKE